MEKLLIERLHLPDLPQHYIFEFLDYNLHRGKYIKKIPNHILTKLDDLIRNPKNNVFVNDRYSYDYDNDGNEFIDVENSFVVIELWLYGKLYHRDLVHKAIEIKHSHEDKNKCYVSTVYYAEDFDGSIHDYDPCVPW